MSAVPSSWIAQLDPDVREELATLAAQLAEKRAALDGAGSGAAGVGDGAAAAGVCVDLAVTVRKRSLLRHLVRKMFILPRQARNNHRESTQKSTVFSQNFDTIPDYGCSEVDVLCDPGYWGTLDGVRTTALQACCKCGGGSTAAGQQGH